MEESSAGSGQYKVHECLIWVKFDATFVGLKVTDNESFLNCMTLNINNSPKEYKATLV